MANSPSVTEELSFSLRKVAGSILLLLRAFGREKAIYSLGSVLQPRWEYKLEIPPLKFCCLITSRFLVSVKIEVLAR
jgi:hypothetical protein